jgi:hypothetical protein
VGSGPPPRASGGGPGPGPARASRTLQITTSRAGSTTSPRRGIIGAWSPLRSNSSATTSTGCRLRHGPGCARTRGAPSSPGCVSSSRAGPVRLTWPILRGCGRSSPISASRRPLSNASMPGWLRSGAGERPRRRVLACGGLATARQKSRGAARRMRRLGRVRTPLPIHVPFLMPPRVPRRLPVARPEPPSTCLISPAAS